MVEWAGTDRHILFKSPAAGLRIFHVAIDILHVMDLGVCQHICGSVLYLMVFGTAIPGSLEKNIQVAREQLCAAYEALGTKAGERLPHALRLAPL